MDHYIDLNFKTVPKRCFFVVFSGSVIHLKHEMDIREGYEKHFKDWVARVAHGMECLRSSQPTWGDPFFDSWLASDNTSDNNWSYSLVTISLMVTNHTISLIHFWITHLMSLIFSMHHQTESQQRDHDLRSWKALWKRSSRSWSRRFPKDITRGWRTSSGASAELQGRHPWLWTPHQSVEIGRAPFGSVGFWCSGSRPENVFGGFSSAKSSYIWIHVRSPKRGMVQWKPPSILKHIGSLDFPGIPVP